MSKAKRVPRNVKAEPLNETLTVTETLVEVVNEPLEPIVEEKPEEPRSVLVYWHKSCSNVKKTTKTTLKVNEILRLTDATVTIDEKIVPVYSLKRNKRIYYLIDVTPNDIVKAASEKKRLDALKEAESKVKEA